MNPPPTGVTVIVHTRNSARTLPVLLRSTAWAHERIVVDMESSDDTVALATQAGCRVLATAVVPRVDGIRNRYLDEARTEWILVLDSDEYLADDAEQEVQRLVAEAGTAVDAYALPRHNRIAGQWMKGSGWYPDWQIRLFRRGTVQWEDAHHRAPRVCGGSSRLRVLQPPGCLHIHHDNYTSLAEVIRRQMDYALSDHYDPDPDAFHFAESVREAYQAYALRLDPEHDGDLSRALAHIMAWDRVMRGILHWDKLGRCVPLDDAFSLPVYPQGPPPWWIRWKRKLARKLGGWSKRRKE